MDKALIYKWVNFVIFLGSLVYFLKNPIRDFLGDRRESLKRELELVARERLAMEQRFNALRKQMAGADSEITDLKKELRQEGEKEKANLVKKSQSFAQKIREDATRIASQELNKTKLMLQTKTLLLSVDLARGLLERSIHAEDQSRLLIEGIKQLEKFNETKSAG
ncbi:MAG: ATP synthase F0 subunit B [Deltaproteobacteria bacterium]|nr:ATP synthase F0 subunit B [Deltaproteobacteria bacterium]